MNSKTANGRPAAGKSLGTAACTAIVVGNMVGSGFYLSPAAVAPYGNLAILAWIAMGAGAICLGLTFAKLARLAPATGGPYAYTRMAYGDFAGFLIAWGYWISIWASLPVIAIAFAGAAFDLLPGLHNRTMAVVLTLGAIWAVVLINLRGVKEAGIFAEVTTYTKLIPFAAIALVGLFFIDRSNFSEFNPSGKSLFGASAALAPLTMFAFLGLESATVPAGDVVDPKRTIPRSTVLGITIATLLYVLGTIAVMGLVPREQLVQSVAPFSDAARALWGSWGATAISIAVIVSAIGALNGWTLLMVQDHIVLGYAFVHPWRLNDIPKLDELLLSLPSNPDCLLIHDVAVLQHVRGKGASQSLVERISGLAQRCNIQFLALVSVYGSNLLWARFGFEPTDMVLAPELTSYGETARYMVRRLD